MALSDRVAVLRKGKYIGTVHTKTRPAQKLTDMMVGHAVTLNIDRPDACDPKPRLEVKGSDRAGRRWESRRSITCPSRP